MASYANSAARKRASEQKDPERVARTVMVEHLSAGYNEQVMLRCSTWVPPPHSTLSRFGCPHSTPRETCGCRCVQAIAAYFDAVGRVLAVRIDKTPDKNGSPRVWVEFETQGAAHDACELSGQVYLRLTTGVANIVDDLWPVQRSSRRACVRTS